MVFLTVDVSPLDGREPGEGVDGAENKLMGNLGAVE